VIRRINADFIPLALNAPTVDQPDEKTAEGRLLKLIRASRPAQQGICVLNGDGQVLEWVITFDNPESILPFLEHGLKQFHQQPDGKKAIATKRFMRFQGMRLEDFMERARVDPTPSRHTGKEMCCGDTYHPEGTLAVKVFGRALDADGKLSTETTRQESYIQDHLEMTPGTQEFLVQTLQTKDGARVRIPELIAQEWIKHAHLGHIDVQPISNPLGGSHDLRVCDFWAEAAQDGVERGWFRVSGKSDVTSQLDAMPLRN